MLSYVCGFFVCVCFFFFFPKSLFHQLIVMTIVAMAAMRMAVADMTRMATVVMHKNNGSKEGEREL